MRVLSPLDECECGHYRVTHNSQTSLNEANCNSCMCKRFSLKEASNERREVKNQAWWKNRRWRSLRKTSSSSVQSATRQNRSSTSAAPEAGSYNARTAVKFSGMANHQWQ